MFKDDLLAGKTVEEEVAKILRDLGYTVRFNGSPDINILKLWDLKAIKNGVETLLEVKADFKSKVTGNVAIEERCVLESEAKYFVYKLGEEFWYTLRSNLLYELNREGKFIWGGDGNRARLKLVKVEEFKKYSKLLGNE